ncbi:MAG: glycosyltransferase [Bacteroidetes bacterium]|nr:glycosyltransferase [Bacteroidota bacterium]
MSTVPFFSIITPAYNSEKMIATTIDSVLAQTFPDWELLIIDATME